MRFEREHIDTATADGELLLTLLASFAQEESRSLSENVKWAIRRRYTEGETNSFWIYGYTWTGDSFTITEAEAAVVRLLFDNYFNSVSPEKIATWLNENGYRSRNSGRFYGSVMRRMLENERCKGCQMLQKTFTARINQWKHVPNTGQVSKYWVEGALPAIITPDVFYAVQAEIVRRQIGPAATPSKNTGCFAGKITCPACGCNYQRKTRTVTTIPATKTFSSGVHSADGMPAVKRVAAYAQVSTDPEEQQSSYQAQVDYYTSYITGHAGWQLAGVYTDEGISGSSTKHREGFKQMVADALAGKIDLIVTKTVSRFARNTVDTLTHVRELKDHGVEVYLEKENIRTLDSKGELLITIMSSLAQEESRSISENVTWGHHRVHAQRRHHYATTQLLTSIARVRAGLAIQTFEVRASVRGVFLASGR